MQHENMETIGAMASVRLMSALLPMAVVDPFGERKEANGGSATDEDYKDIFTGFVQDLTSTMDILDDEPQPDEGKDPDISAEQYTIAALSFVAEARAPEPVYDTILVGAMLHATLTAIQGAFDRAAVGGEPVNAIHAIRTWMDKHAGTIEGQTYLLHQSVFLLAGDSVQDNPA